MVALLTVGASVLGGCTNGGKAGGDRVFQDKRFNITFRYPGEFRAAHSEKTTASRGNALADAAIALDQDNSISITKYDVKVAITKGNLGQITSDVDGVVGQVAGGSPHGTAVEVAGFPALRYDGVVVPKLADGQSRVVFVFDQSSEYEINCQSTPSKRDRVTAACDQVLSTWRTTAPPPSTGGAAIPTTTPARAGADLATKAVPAPKGYQLRTDSGDLSGPISAAQFDDKIVGLSGGAGSYGFIAGYQRDFDSVASSGSVFVTLLEFASPTKAAAFLPTAATVTNATDEAPVRKDYAAISGAFVVDGTKADSHGFHDHAVVAAKGSVVMIVDVSAEAAGPSPTLLATVASQQYGRL